MSTKAGAIAWASARETEIRTGKATGIERGRTVGDAFPRYEKEVSVHKDGQRWASLRLVRLGAWEVAGAVFSEMKLAEVTSNILGRCRDHRMNVDKVSGSTVNRELNLMSHVFATAAKEWKWIASSPTTDVRRPKESPARDRLYTDDEIERICFALGFDQGAEEHVEAVSQRIAVAFLFAIETAMRVSEICGLMPRDIVGRVATLTETKNGTKRSTSVDASSIAAQAAAGAREGQNRVRLNSKIARRAVPQGRDQGQHRRGHLPRQPPPCNHQVGQEAKCALPGTHSMAPRPQATTGVLQRDGRGDGRATRLTMH
jgi:integrase